MRKEPALLVWICLVNQRRRQSEERIRGSLRGVSVVRKEAVEVWMWWSSVTACLVMLLWRRSGHYRG